MGILLTQMLSFSKQNHIHQSYIFFVLVQSIERVAVVETIAKNTNMAGSSIHSESTSSQLDQIFTSQSKSHTQVSLYMHFTLPTYLVSIQMMLPF